ncbi:uncharacterized protein LOC108146495 isoform X2 [Drosophila elegans]|uniref:uncharacterized protein LOC108146495 isoform X1 n=1 Tax=Drosophila elegans TaxID=30023 RepID=UPI0007E6F8DA|nr:uncharacterized protein LOC108146495 isoform X1 [Drosophila elegans]XP_017128017.1 uncharacterized protein LOC108146495 isoform X2 [Drosophila elegans]
MFLTKSSSARHSLLLLLLAFCCLSSAFGAKITKKAEKPSEKPEAEAAESPVEEENDDDDENDDEEEEEEEQSVADKEAAAPASSNNKNPNAVQAATDPTDLSVWGMVRTLWGWLRSDLSESLFGDDDNDKDDGKPASGSSAVEGRTFGKIRRLQMALIPIIFKFGVLSAMVAFLVAIGMKSLFLLKVLVVMNAIAILGKFITLKSSLFGQYEHTAPSFNYPGWNLHAKESSWGTTGLSGHGGGHPPSKEIHLHIHGNAQTQAQLAGQGYQYESQLGGGWASRSDSDPYAAYAPTGQFTNSQPVGAVAGEVPNNTDPMSLLPTKYRARRLIR